MVQLDSRLQGSPAGWTTEAASAASTPESVNSNLVPPPTGPRRRCGPFFQGLATLRRNTAATFPGLAGRQAGSRRSGKIDRVTAPGACGSNSPDTSFNAFSAQYRSRSACQMLPWRKILAAFVAVLVVEPRLGGPAQLPAPIADRKSFVVCRLRTPGPSARNGGGYRVFPLLAGHPGFPKLQ